MKVIILAAGYATRLYPLTLTRPKPLLPVAGKPMIEYVLDNIAPIAGVDRVYVVSNAKFAAQFQDWADQYQAANGSSAGTWPEAADSSPAPPLEERAGERRPLAPLVPRGEREHPKFDFKIINDGSTDDSNKLGAIGDIHFVLQTEKLADDLIIVAGDNLFSEKLGDFGHFCREKHRPVLAVYDVGNLDEIKKYNAITMDAEGRITFFEEKPKQPASTLTGIALYFYPRDTIPLIEQYVAEGNNPDQPGRLVQWLYPRVPFYTWKVPGLWYDIGSKETLEEANRIFAKQ